MRAWWALWVGLVLAGCAGPVERPGWVRPDLDPAWVSGGGVRWPPDDGFKGAAVPIVLPAGVLLDRFGPDTGRFLSPKGAGFRARALPTVCATQPYSAFRVALPLPVWIGRAAAWFDEPGGATQVQTDATVAQLLADGVLVRVAEAKAPC
jgi:hypothetical protein